MTAYALVGSVTSIVTPAATLAFHATITGSVTVVVTPSSVQGKQHYGDTSGVTFTATPASWMQQYNYKVTGSTTVNLSVAGSMAYTTVGYGAIDFPALTLSATGYVPAAVTCDLDFPALTLSATGGSYAELSFPDLVLDATGTTELTANAALAFPEFTVTATGFTNFNADGALAFPSLTVTARGGGNALLSLPLFTIDATGSSDSLATVEIAFPALSVSGTGTYEEHGNGAISFPELVFSHADISIDFPVFSVGGSSVLNPANILAYVTNLRTMETIVYNNFPFSDIIIVDNVAYGVMSDGLYSFDTTTDSGTAINGSITTKETDFGVFTSKRVAEIYLNSDTATTVKPKVDGKWAPMAYPSSFGGRKALLPLGLEGRYWAFQINNIQQLEGIEVMPNKRQRRVK